MTSSPLSNVLLPAVFISSAVFSSLTLPFALIKSEPVVVELPPFFSSEIQPIFNGEHKDVAIPYVGFAIVVSVGAGIASVEVTRRWQAYREGAMEKEPSPNLQQNSKATEAQQEALNLPEYRPEVSAIDLASKDEVFRSQSLTTPDAMTEENHIAVEAPEQVVDFTQFVEPQPTLPEQTTALEAVEEKLNFSSSQEGNNSVQIESAKVGLRSAVQEKDLAFSKILESRSLYQTCRIKVPHLERRLFAILVNDQYYSFFRAEKTLEKALEVIAKLGHRVEKTVITKTEKGYVIWAKEPEVSSQISS
ncbi:MAG TPA: hypothetical protein V6D12_24130 [Candidatus Obscuribacterales bacterium]|jgi:hypothetical protein